ncbi:hypothetical protein VOLCADRAFT_58521, partial [Volvox carteri f. nagariensis]
LSPLKAPKLTELREFDASYKDRLLWGSYRSGLYFGMRTRTPKALLSGLLWFDPDDPNTLNQMRARHEASQGDGLTTYGWKRHDGRLYGTQELIDGEYNITLSMLKSFSPESGPGGDWSVRLQLARTAGTPPRRRRISIVMVRTAGVACASPFGGSCSSPSHFPHSPCLPQVLPDGEVADLRSGPATLLTGASSALGRSGARLALHAMETTDGEERPRPSSNRFRLYLPNGATTSADLALFQVTCVLPSAVDFAFTSSAGGDRLGPLLGSGLSEALAAKQAEFDQRRRVFGSGLRAPLSGGRTVTSEGGEGSLPDGALEVSRAALSNLLGSVGYFYGSSLVGGWVVLAIAKRRMGGWVRTDPPGSEPRQYWPAPLFTAVPSRSFFPRGFLWDEGFHQLLVQRWDPQLCRDMIAHWLDLMNAHGWIPREQILGEEARTRVPAEFVVQNPNHANPPSLFLPIAKMASQLEEQEEEEELQRVSAFLRRAWPRLEAWYRWFNVTQAGPLPTSYRWHGRDPLAAGELNPKTLTSGLDDYPRASHPDDSERHLDLRCWMALASQRYRAAAASLSDRGELQRLHFDSTLGRFADWGMHTEDVHLGRRVRERILSQSVSQRVTSTPPTPQFVPQFGYVSLFPLIMKLLPTGTSTSADDNDPAAAELTLQQLQLLQDPALLWSPHGLRSLATTASLYKKRNTADDPPYWRGQIWVNMNYLVLRSLSYYAKTAGSGSEVGRVAAAAHDELRLRLLKTLVENYKRNGYLYEQYDDETGRGISSHPFTGWTALVTLIMAQDY